MIALVAFGISAAGSSRPSLWLDEAASVSAARRSVPQLWLLTHHVDAVHGLYYLGLHYWFHVVPYSPFSLRFPSAIATGVAAGLTVILTTRLAGSWPGWVAGLLYCVLPRVTLQGTEGRSYAFTAVAALALTLVFITAVSYSRAGRRRAWGWWAVYALVTVLSGVLFFYTVLLVLGHGFSLLFGSLARLGPRTRRGRGATVLPWLGAVVLALLVLAPFIKLIASQTGQVSWLLPVRPGLYIVKEVFVEQWFIGAPLFAVFAWIAMILGVVATLRLPRLKILRDVVEVALPAVVAPAIVIVLISVIHPLYVPRYLTFSSPFVAMLLALGVLAIPARRLLQSLSLVLAAVLVIVPYLAQREPDAKSTTWDRIAARIASERSEASGAGREGIIYGRLPEHLTYSAEFVEIAYPNAFSGMLDLTARSSAASIGQLSDARTKIPNGIMPTPDLSRIWFVGAATGGEPAATTDRLEQLGWHRTNEWQSEGLDVVVYGH